MSSLTTALALGLTISIAAGVSVLVYHIQKKKEALEAQLKSLTAQCHTLIAILHPLSEVPIDPEIFNILSNQLECLTKSISALNPFEANLATLQQSARIFKATRPPETHVAFSKNTSLQHVLKSLRSLPGLIEKYLPGIHPSKMDVWKSHLAILALEVEQKYYMRVCDTLFEKGKKRDAINAVNHALNLLEKFKHLTLKEREPTAQMLKEKKQKYFDG